MAEDCEGIMPGTYTVLHKQDFTATDTIAVTHDLGRYPFGLVVQVVIDGETRNDLIRSILPDSDDPINKLNVILTSSQSGALQVLNTDIARFGWSPLIGTQVTATVTTSTTSGSYVSMNGMTITPAAGTYLVSFSASGRTTSNGDTGDCAIHVGGAIVQHSERTLYGNRQTAASIHCQAKVTVNGEQAIDVRFKQAGGNFNVYERSLIIMEVV